MTRPAAALATAALIAAAPIAARPARADGADRAAYVGRLLVQLRALDPAGRDRVERAIYDAARTRCRAEASPPAAACLIDVARSVCRPADDRCAMAADVIATNLRGATALVDEPTRARLVRGGGDYRAALAGELRRRHALLAAELAIAGGEPAAGAGEAALIDRFCAERDRTTHACMTGDAGCVPSLPWSRCVAALVWFIAGAP